MLINQAAQQSLTECQENYVSDPHKTKTEMGRHVLHSDHRTNDLPRDKPSSSEMTVSFTPTAKEADSVHERN